MRSLPMHVTVIHGFLYCQLLGPWKLAGSGASSASSSSDGATLREMRETLMADIGEGCIGVFGEDLAAVVRRTNAFELNPYQFFVYYIYI